MENFDWIIVGAGSAGCVLANRLSANGSRVLLLEAGGEGRHPFIEVPLAFPRLLGKPAYDWALRSAPEPGLDNRRVVLFQGRVLGGSSAINGMLYARGHAADYDGWAQQGCSGWAWSDVLPLFRRSENFEDGASEIHGAGGELAVARSRYRSPLMDQFVEASAQAGWSTPSDYLEPDPLGCAPAFATLRNGRRCSSARAFLDPARRRRNLTVVTDASVQKLTLEGRKVTGVQYRRGNEVHTVRAREVLLSAGALHSPQLLELSGIGQAQRLRELGIDVTLDHPGVGENLHDHPFVPLAFRVGGKGSANADLRGWRLAREIVRYALSRQGVLTATPGLVTGYLKLRPGAASADIQIFARPFTTESASTTFAPEKLPGLGASVSLCRPRSRGATHVVSSDPDVPPEFRLNYLSDEEDLALLAEAIEAMRSIAAQPALADVMVNELLPGPEVAGTPALRAYARRAAGSTYHPVGSCRMGGDPAAVVDPRLRVRDIGGLRVVDASVMPSIVSGNTNAPTIMIAEKAAEMILADSRR